QPAEDHDPVDGVGARHQRGVQRVGHLGDDDEADEAGEHEDGEVGDEHRRAPYAAAPAACLAPSCTISPPRVTHAPAITSSSKSSASAPSSSAISSSSAWMLRAYICEACSAIWLGRLSGASIVTSW